LILSLLILKIRKNINQKKVILNNPKMALILGGVQINNVLSDSETERTHNYIQDSGWERDSYECNQIIKEDALKMKYEMTHQIVKKVEKFLNSGNSSILHEKDDSKIVINY
jgi:hypothetical protein